MTRIPFSPIGGLMTLILSQCVGCSAAAAPFPGAAPGQATAICTDGVATLANTALQATWRLDGSSLVLVQFKDLADGSAISPAMPAFTITFGDGTTVSAADLKPDGPLTLSDLAPKSDASVLSERIPGKAIEVRYTLPAQKLGLAWRAILRDDANYVRQEIVFSPDSDDLVIRTLKLLSLSLPGAQVCGSVQGSPITTENLFLAIEHPVASSRVAGSPFGWASSDFKKGNVSTLLSFNLASVVSSPGDYDVTFQYTRGNHRLDVESVRLLANGDPVAMDEHHGITGLFNKDNNFRLKLLTFDKLAKYTLEVKAFADSGGGAVSSWGDIQIRRNGKPVGSAASLAECSFSRGVPLPVGQPFLISSVLGIAPKGQMRRAFNYYLERERAHPYRPFLHYNSWYDLNIDRPDCRMTEAEAIKAVEDIGGQLTTNRGVALRSYVWDDGWDSRDKVWDFNDGFPQGFTNVAKAAAHFKAGIGLWMSPWGGYGGRDQRIRAGRKFDYETNDHGFSMAGKNYRTHFLDTCLRMIHDYHANFFKFDGMGGGANSDGGDSAYANDMEAIMGVCRDLRKADPNLFISATVGTWPSPFWLRYADSIWRQGSDTDFAGVGNGRERWITYRDSTVFDRIVKRGPLYPIQSLMLHGIVIGERSSPARMDRDEDSVRHEARSFFGSGTDLQELYLTPHLLTPAMWDAIAESAQWAKVNQDCLVDSHWIGGNPGALEVYGFASWIPGKGTITLRNPSDKTRTFRLDIGEAFELPQGAHTALHLVSPYKDQSIQTLTLAPGAPQLLTLQPFEVLVFDAEPTK